MSSAWMTDLQLVVCSDGLRITGRGNTEMS